MANLVLKIDLCKNNHNIGRLISSISLILSKFNFFLQNKITTKNNIKLKIYLINYKIFSLNFKKFRKKKFFKHSKYPGSYKTISYDKIFLNNPKRFFKLIMKGMLSKNSFLKKFINENNFELIN